MEMNQNEVCRNRSGDVYESNRNGVYRMDSAAEILV
jgi:hypothetical protein